MIVSTFTEQEILNELVADFTKSVKPFAKKVARKYLSANKAAFTVGPTLVLDYFYLTSRNNNKWCVIISYTKDKRASWSCSACCVTQGERRSKDYYVVRGLSETPYYIKMSSHVVKRIQERGKMISVPDVEFLPCLIFLPHETGIAINYLNAKYIGNFHLLDGIKFDSTQSKMVVVMKGVFYAFRTDNGNFNFKTFVSNDMTMNNNGRPINNCSGLDKEAFFAIGCFALHQYWNKHLYSEKDLDKFLYTFLPQARRNGGVPKDPTRLALLKP